MNVPVVRKVLEKNNHAASENRALFDRHSVACINMLGGAGSGKTALLEAALPRLKDHLRIAVLEGDLATTRDADRIAALDVPVVQLLTEGGCHLTAAHVQKAITELDLESIELLIIENVGNPICPANFDLGEHVRVAVLSVTEGDDKPSKYPLMFRHCQAVVVSKCDLLQLCNFDMNAVHTDIHAVSPHAEILEISARTGLGVEHWARLLRSVPSLQPLSA